MAVLKLSDLKVGAIGRRRHWKPASASEEVVLIGNGQTVTRDVSSGRLLIRDSQEEDWFEVKPKQKPSERIFELMEKHQDGSYEERRSCAIIRYLNEQAEKH